MGVRILAGISARLLKKAFRRGRTVLVANNRKTSRRLKTSRRKFRMYKSIWS